MMKYLAIMLLIFSCNSIEDQGKNTFKRKKDTLEFIEYKDFELAHKSGKIMKNLDSNIDLHLILLLDSNRAAEFFEFDDKIGDSLKYAASIAKLGRSTIGFRTNFTTLRNVLQSEELRNMIPACLFGEEALENEYKINNPIYINGNIAVVRFFDVNSSFVCYVSLSSDGIVHINMLERIIE